MTNIYLCDDNQIILQKYQDLIIQLAESNNLSIAIKTYSSGEQLLFHLSESPNDADIIYLDVLMGKLNGIDTARKLRRCGCLSEIIFLTSSDEFVFDSFDVSPLNYIRKDNVTETKFEQILLNAVSLSDEKAGDILLCESGSTKKQILLSSISYLDITNRVVNVHYFDKVFQFYSTMEKQEQYLSQKGFMRCHRSFLINLRYVDEIGTAEIRLVDGTSIPAGRTYIKDLKLAFSAYLAGNF